MTALDLSNPGKLPLQDMPEDIAAAMFAAWINGAKMEWWRQDFPQWDHPWASGIHRHIAMRIGPAPAKKLLAPWEWLAPWIKSVAMDGNAVVFGYEFAPTQGNMSWVRNHGNRVCLSTFLIFDTAGVDWRDSLTLRPEGK